MLPRSILLRLLLLATFGCALTLPAGAGARTDSGGASERRPLAGAALHATSSRACEHGDAAPTRATLARAHRAVLCLLNQERARRGLGPLRAERRLQGAAERHSEDMVRRNFFAHTAPGGSSMVDRISRAGYLRGARRWAVGENIAWGTSHLSAPSRIVRAWMHSEGHRRNILNGTFREIGIGIVTGAPRARVPAAVGATYTTDFGYRT